MSFEKSKLKNRRLALNRRRLYPLVESDHPGKHPADRLGECSQLRQSALIRPIQRQSDL